VFNTIMNLTTGTRRRTAGTAAAAPAWARATCRSGSGPG